jgi:ATP-dependent RNA helicase DHX57
LAALPVDVRIGKLMLFGAIFCCIDYALNIAAHLGYRSPFVMPFTQKEQPNISIREFTVDNSDQLTVLKVYKRWLKICSERHQSWAGICHTVFPTMADTGHIC